MSALGKIPPSASKPSAYASGRNESVAAASLGSSSGRNPSLSNSGSYKSAVLSPAAGNTRKRQKAKLTGLDYLIILLLCSIWFTAFGCIYYFQRNLNLLLIGAGFAVLFSLGYMLLGGLRGIFPELEKSHLDNHPQGWCDIRSRY